MSRISSVMSGLVIAASASAQPIAVDDPSFELADLGNCLFVEGFPNSAWEMERPGGGAWRPGTCWDMVAPEGRHVAYSNGGWIRQTLTEAAIAGATYQMSALVGRRNHPCCPFSEVTLTIRAGATVLGQRFVTVDEAPAPGGWIRFSVTGEAPADLPPGQALEIVISTPGVQTDFDAVQVQRGTGCAADFNGDGFLDFFDFTAFVDCFEGVECPPGKDADFNGDGFPDFFDFDAYVAAFDAGC